MTLPDESLMPGMLLDRYELLGLCARGGMGEVWLARLVGKFGFERLFALKTIKSAYATQREARDMFMDEAHMASRIANEHVVSIVDLGEVGGMLYMAMEWVDGDALTMLRQLGLERRVPWQLVARVGLDACTGLQAAHEAKGADGQELAIVHRDVSPHNILVTEGGLAKVIDFGIAKARARLAPASEVGSVKGKIRYMPPEQIRGETGPWTDVFALGVTLYELLDGKPPFDGAGAGEIIGRVLDSEEAAPLPPHVPSAIAEAIMQSVAKNPQRRFRSMRAFRSALDQATLDSGGRPDHSLVSAFVRTNLPEVAATRRRFVEEALKSRRPSLLPRAAGAVDDTVSAGLQNPPAPLAALPGPSQQASVVAAAPPANGARVVLLAAVVVAVAALAITVLRNRVPAPQTERAPPTPQKEDPDFGERRAALMAEQMSHPPLSPAEIEALLESQPACNRYFRALRKCVEVGTIPREPAEQIRANVGAMIVNQSRSGMTAKDIARSWLNAECVRYLEVNPVVQGCAKLLRE